MVIKAASETGRIRAAESLRIVVTNAAYGVLCRRSLKRLPGRKIDLQSFSSVGEVRLPKKEAATTIFISSLADLPEKGAKQVLHAAGESKHLLFLEGLPIEAMPSRLLQLDIRNPHRLHLAAGRNPNRIAELIYRLVSGMTDPDGPQPIVDAWFENDNLVLLSPAFDRLVVPMNRLAKFIGTKASEREAFEIDNDGRFLFWPHADVHLGWEQFRQILDPAAAVAAKLRSREFNQHYGAAIRMLREEHGLKQSDIAGLTDRHLRRVEHGEAAVSKSALESLANAHGLPLEEYLKQLAERLSVVKGR